MEANVVVELGGNRYLLTQKTTYNRTDYFVAVSVDKKNEITDKYGIFKEVKQGNKTLLSLVENYDELNAVYKKLADELMQELKEDKDYLPVGKCVEWDGKEYVLLDYITLELNVYMVFATTSKPFGLLVARRTVDAKDKVQLEDVTASELGLRVIEEFSELHKK